MSRLKIERNPGYTLAGADELDAELFNEGNIWPKGGRLVHAKP